MKKIIFALLLICCWSVPAMGAVKGESVTYNAGDMTMNGYMAYDDSITLKRPEQRNDSWLPCRSLKTIL
jgi:hypothetical protein